jgi:hypothetical protein
MTNDRFKAEAKVSAIKRDIADAQAVIQSQDAAVRVAQAKAASLRTALANSGLDQKLAAAMAALDQAEELAFYARADQVAAKVLRLNATDPLKHRAEISALLVQLRDAIPGLDWPVNKEYPVLTLPNQALKLLPPLDPLHTPGNVSRGEIDPWPTRRRAFLDNTEAEFNTPPEVEAA